MAEVVWGVAGCDSHKHTVTIAVLDGSGTEIEVATFGNHPAALKQALEWLRSFPLQILRVGVEGSANWGRHLAAFLARGGLDIREVPPTRTTDRRRRRRRPKTDREDALAVAREVLSDALLPPAKVSLAVSDAHAELAVICERRRSLMKRRQRLLNETEAILNKLPQELVISLGPGASVRARLRALVKAEISNEDRSVAIAEMITWLRDLGTELEQWEAGIRGLEQRMEPLVEACGSTLTEEVGIGVVSAAELIVAVADPARFRNEGAFARWCGVAPVAVSSGEGEGQPSRHRLDLLGNRNVNRILYTMSVTQARHHEPGREFLARKRLEGKSAKEARRAHMRQLAKRVIRRMWADQKRQRVSTSSTVVAAA